ncbi:MAG: sigma 54-interacting transcriptional regulator [Spirochaetales bacterium]|nr:sigma 54-interacting transcriptional regulator [Spirochaetales bacterium]
MAHSSALHQTEHGSNELRLLYDIGSLLCEAPDIETVLPPVLETIARYLSIHRGIITIVNRNNGEIVIEEAWGYGTGEIEKGHYQPGEGIIGRVIETGNPVAVPRISEEPRFLDRTGARKGEDTRSLSFICVPIKAGNETLGAIGIDTPYIPGVSLDSVVKLLSIIASSISQAVKLRQDREEEFAKLREENERLQAALHDQFRPSTVVGNSKIMRLLYQQIEQVSPTNATVLLLGESGVGKERIAHAIHYGSPRANRSFIKLNCAAIPESLVESELFGHEKGSFTNAVSARKGRFELADQGTLFLDEIGEMPLPAQATFLRVLQEREFERVGGSETLKVNVRIIAATNRDLERLVREGRFREDLFYRLNVFPLIVPPLRERKTDILLLANYFLEKFSKEHGKKILTISSPATHLLMKYEWPGNVRELENCMERAVILSTDETIHSYHLPPGMQTGGDGATRSGGLTEVMDAVEREILIEELGRTGGNVARAAANLGITERMMGLRVRKHGLR